MNNTAVIDQFLNVFTQYIDSGFGLVGGDVRWLSTTLIVIDMTLAGLFWAMAGEEDILARLIKKTLYVGFFAFVIGNFNGLCKVVYESFSGLGLEASGSTLSAQTLLQPGKLAQVGIDAGKPILAAASSLTGYVSIVTNAIPIFVLLVAWVVVVLSFFVLAIQLFIVLIEFKLTTLAGFVLIPFALFNKTAFLAEKVLGNVVASGVKILVLAVSAVPTAVPAPSCGAPETRPVAIDGPKMPRPNSDSAPSMIDSASSIVGWLLPNPCVN